MAHQFPFSDGAFGPFSAPPGLANATVNAYRAVYFVSPAGSDGNTGLGAAKENSFQTVQKALNTVDDEDTIIVMMGDYDEALTTGEYIGAQSVVTPGSAGPGRGRNVSLIGATPTPYPFDSPQLYNVSGSGQTLDVRSSGWRISGFTILGDSGSPLGVKLSFDQANPDADTSWAAGTTIDHCVFFGVKGDMTGLDFVGSPQNCRITDNIFEIFLTALSPCIASSSTPTAQAYRTIIARNFFFDSKEYISLNPRGFNSSHFLYNTFDSGHTYTVTIYLDNGGGSNCAVHGNYFPGDYSNTGGYRAGSGDNWSGNFADDTGEAEVGTDTGITLLVPAA